MEVISWVGSHLVIICKFIAILSSVVVGLYGFYKVTNKPIRKLIKIIERIYYEFSDNGGGSMKDRIARLVVMVDELSKDARFSKEKYKKLIDELPYPFYENDANGSTILVNKAWVEVTGLPFDLAIGHGWVKIVHPEDLPRMQSEGKDYMNDGEDYEGSFRFIHWQTKKVFEVHCTASKIRDEHGNLSGIIGKLHKV